MEKKLILLKINNLKNLFEEFKEQYDFYLKQEEKSFLQRTSLFAVQKKLEEVVEYSIKINKILLKDKNIHALSYQESFLLLEELGLNKDIINKMSELALFRNKLAHEYLNLNKEDSIYYSKELLNYFPDYFNELVNFIQTKN